MAKREGDLAVQVKAQGGDGLIMNSDGSNYVGTISTENASAFASGNSIAAFGTGVSMPIYRQSSTYFVIKYIR